MSTRRTETLSRGTPVQVTGKVDGADWLRIALAGGRTAYIFAPLLRDAAPPGPAGVVSSRKRRNRPRRSRRLRRLPGNGCGAGGVVPDGFAAGRKTSHRESPVIDVSIDEEPVLSRND